MVTDLIHRKEFYPALLIKGSFVKTGLSPSIFEKMARNMHSGTFFARMKTKFEGSFQGVQR